MRDDAIPDIIRAATEDAGPARTQAPPKPTARRRPPMPADSIPDLIAAAGEPAVRAYREFLDATRSPNTRRVYRSYICGFCRWAETRNLPVALIAPSDIAAYVEPLSSHATYVVVSVLRNLFRHLVAAGVLADNPCGRHGRPRPDQGTSSRSPARFARELQAVRRRFMAKLDERYGDDPTFRLIRSIDRLLADHDGGADAHG